VNANGRVLVVDPEPIVTELIERRLRAAGFETAAAATGQEALSVAGRERFDVILLAMSLPDVDGLGVLSRLRAMPGLDGASIALTASMHRDPESLVRALDLGADDYLRKPIEAVELVARVRALLRLRRHVTELRAQTERLAALNAELERLAVRDPLTGVYNRRHLEQRLAEETDRARRYGQPLTVILCDVDHFKKVNDTHGHAAGDEVLRNVAKLIGRTIRRVDLLARFGGEEFVVVAPATDAAGARVLAERLRAAVAAMPVLTTNGSGMHVALRVTASFGVATARGADQTPAAAHELVAAADLALYRAKANGRNRVEFAGEE
jgi:diguanylate cyclase (GGDEF)-like protein